MASKDDIETIVAKLRSLSVDLERDLGILEQVIDEDAWNQLNETVLAAQLDFVVDPKEEEFILPGVPRSVRAPVFRRISDIYALGRKSQVKPTLSDARRGIANLRDLADEMESRASWDEQNRSAVKGALLLITGAGLLITNVNNAHLLSLTPAMYLLGQSLPFFVDAW